MQPQPTGCWHPVHCNGETVKRTRAIFAANPFHLEFTGSTVRISPLAISTSTAVPQHQPSPQAPPDNCGPRGPKRVGFPRGSVRPRQVATCRCLRGPCAQGRTRHQGKNRDVGMLLRRIQLHAVPRPLHSPALHYHDILIVVGYAAIPKIRVTISREASTHAGQVVQTLVQPY